MRIIFNHGLTPGELYTNIPAKITNKKWTWFIKRYGYTDSYNDSLAEPFKYCFSLIMNRIIDDRVRFKIPYSDSYIDFETVTGNKLEEQRQNGRFMEIDLVGSDFTGYAIRYYYSGKAYQKSLQVYIGGDLKEKFLTNVNSGIRYYTTKDITIYDFIDEVKDKFNELSTKEIKSLLLIGFRRMNSCIKYGCYITINTKKFTNCFVHIGNLSTLPEKQIKTYSNKRDKKLRKIAAWNRLDFDGYYYIGLNRSSLEKWILANKNSKSVLKFSNVMIRKLQEELYYKDKEIYVFRVKEKKFIGWLFYKEEYKARNVEYLGKSTNLKFTTDTKTWKQLIKEYEWSD